MVFTKNDFSESQLETLANLGIVPDNGVKQKLRIGRQMAKQMGLGGGRWLNIEEDSKVKDAIAGYVALPEEMKAQDAYSPLDYFHLSAAAGQFGVQEPTRDYAALQAGLEERLGAANFRITGNGRPPQKIRDMYFDYNVEQEAKGHAPATTKQFIETLVDGVESEVRELKMSAVELIEGVKKDIRVSPQDALINAVEASYKMGVVKAVTPLLETAKERYAKREMVAPLAAVN